MRKNGPVVTLKIVVPMLKAAHGTRYHCCEIAVAVVAVVEVKGVAVPAAVVAAAATLPYIPLIVVRSA